MAEAELGALVLAVEAAAAHVAECADPSDGMPQLMPSAPESHFQAALAATLAATAAPGTAVARELVVPQWFRPRCPAGPLPAATYIGARRIDLAILSGKATLIVETKVAATATKPLYCNQARSYVCLYTRAAIALNAPTRPVVAAIVVAFDPATAEPRVHRVDPYAWLSHEA